MRYYKPSFFCSLNSAGKGLSNHMNFHGIVRNNCIHYQRHSYVGLVHTTPPTNTKCKPFLLPTQAGIPYANSYKHRASSYFLSALIFLGPAEQCKCISADQLKLEILAISLSSIRECGSTLYVRLAHTVPPTNTNFWLTFLLPRLQEALYGDIPE